MPDHPQPQPADHDGHGQDERAHRDQEQDDQRVDHAVGARMAGHAIPSFTRPYAWIRSLTICGRPRPPVSRALSPEPVVWLYDALPWPRLTSANARFASLTSGGGSLASTVAASECVAAVLPVAPRVTVHKRGAYTTSLVACVASTLPFSARRTSKVFPVMLSTNIRSVPIRISSPA